MFILMIQSHYHILVRYSKNWKKNKKYDCRNSTKISLVSCGNIGKIGIPNTHLNDLSLPALVQAFQKKVTGLN